MIDDAEDLAAALRKQGGDVTVVHQQDGIHRQPTWAAMLPATRATSSRAEKGLVR